MNCLEECNISQVIFMLTKDTALLNQYRTSPITAPRSCKTWIPSQKIDFPLVAIQDCAKNSHICVAQMTEACDVWKWGMYSIFYIRI